MAKAELSAHPISSWAGQLGEAGVSLVSKGQSAAISGNALALDIFLALLASYCPYNRSKFAILLVRMPAFSRTCQYFLLSFFPRLEIAIENSLEITDHFTLGDNYRTEK